ncbi:MAG: hypothetical protein ACR2FH_01205 [Caulobacteraceae bacterium]
MTHELTLARADFALALEIATTGVSAETDTEFSVRLDFFDGVLTATGPGAAGEAPASGEWSGAVLISATAAKNIASRLPTIKPFVVAARPGRLSIGGFSMTATLIKAPPPVIDVVLGSSHREVLVAVERHGEARVLASLGDLALDRAVEAREEAIGAAMHELRMFRVERRDIEAAVTGSLRRQAALPTDRS